MIPTLAAALLLSASATAQEPAFAPWKVVETEHYRVHYPEPAEEWTLRQVERMESIRARVAEEVGYVPDFQVQVVVQDPVSEANGAVLALGRSPRMILWTTPPGADSTIGHYRDWGELLITHEDAHVVHLLRPARAFPGQLMQWLFRLTPITIKSPRWVIEGYATVVEGRLTGSGRPHGALRATLLRRLAQQGALPSYGELSGSSRWQGYGYAYLVGSAYLEWLEDRAAEQGREHALRDLWARMTAKKVRTFDQAFEGLFGDKPWVLYNRFKAEVTADAMRADGADWSRDSLWMDVAWTTGVPALSPDGSKLAVVRASRDDPPALMVWNTEVNQEALDERAERIAEILERDPEDAPPGPLKHPPHKRVFLLQDRTHPPRNARWVDDETLVYDSGRVDRYRRIRRDLFTVDIESGRTRRVTSYGDVRDPDPHPDGTWAVAVQGSFGRTRLSRIELDDGKITPMTALTADRVVDMPRFDASGDRVAYLVQHAEPIDGSDQSGFRPVVRDLNTGEELDVLLPEGASVIHHAWMPSESGREDALVASLALNGRLDLWRLPLFTDEEPTRLTDHGSALAPEPQPARAAVEAEGEDDEGTPAVDAGLFYLQMQADGLEVHFEALDGAVRPEPDDDIGLVGLADPLDAEPNTTAPIDPQPAGVGRLEPRILVGGEVGQGASNFEGGLRLGDIMGRNDLVVLGSLGDFGGTSGGGAWWANRTLPAVVESRVWFVQDGLSPPWNLGGSVGLHSEAGTLVSWLTAETGAWAEVDLEGKARGELYAHGTATWVAPRSRWIRVWSDAQGSIGQSDGFNTTLGRGRLGLSLGRTWQLQTQYTIGFAGGEPFTLGGVTSGVRAEAAQWRQIRNGWLRPDTATGTVHDTMEWAIASGGIELMLERHRIWTGTGVSPYSLAGLRIVQSVDRQSLVKVPGVDIEIGIGCAFEQGSIVERPCRNLADYRTWSGVIWRP